MTLLSLRNAAAHYGPSQALFDVSLDIAEGEVVALMGRNGMGKTTTVKTLLRMLPLTGGSLTFAGTDMTRWPSHRAARAGLGLVPEGRRCFGPLTVRENLTAAARPGDWDLARVGRLFPRLTERLDQKAATLSGGEQQMLAIGRALMTNPRLMVLDEATEGLAPLVRQDIWRALGEVKAETGLSLLIVDKSLRELGAIADRAVVLARGTSVWTGPIGAMPDEVRERHLGV